MTLVLHILYRQLLTQFDHMLLLFLPLDCAIFIRCMETLFIKLAATIFGLD
jgi:hypothetical protein